MAEIRNSGAEGSDVLLVTGASGQLGRLVLAHLLDTCGVAPERLIAVTRDPAKLAAVAARGVSVRRGDFEDAATLGRAFAGADRLLLISTDTLDRPGARLVQHRAAIASAKEAGVRHILYTSMPDPAQSPIPFAPDHLGTEQALAASGIGYTILRNAWYFENIALSLPAILATGKWFTASGDGRTSSLSRDDCARAAAFALASTATQNAILDITGPAARTTAETAAALNHVLGTAIELVQVSDAELVQGMIGAGLPEPMARIFASFDAAARLGNFALVTNAVEELTGQAPETLEAFLAHSASALLPKSTEEAA